MAEEFQDDRITEELHDTAKIIEPTDDQYEELLQNILEQTDTQGSVSFAQASARANRLSTFRVVHSVGHLLKTRAGVAVVAAALFLVVAITQVLPGSRDGNIIIDDPSVPLVSDPMQFSGVTYRVGEIQTDGESSLNVTRLATTDRGFVIYMEGGNQLLWEEAYAQDGAGNRQAPLEINPQEQSLEFRLTGGELTIYLKDQSGSQFTIPVIPE